MIPRRLQLASLLLAVGGCLLYTHDINEAPTVSIEAPALAPFRGTPTVISARAHDNQDPPERLTVAWVVADGACPADAEASPPPGGATGTGLQYALVITGFGPVCVYARATDSAGAAGPWQHRQFVGKNRAPRAHLDISPSPASDGSIPIYSRVVVSPAGSIDEDGDPLDFHWQLSAPDGSDWSACPATAPPEARCFVPRREGPYAVQLIAEEKLPAGVPRAASAPESRTLVVDPDRPPCLALTTPAIYQSVVLIPSGTRRTFQVSSVRDDGEPYPGPGENGETLFVWSISQPGTAALDHAGAAPLQRTALGGPSFEVAEDLFGNLRLGDQFRIRVEVRDKVREAAFGASLAGAPCADDVPVCEDRSGKGGSACIRWATWTVQFYP